MTVEEAAKKLGVSAQFIRIGLQQGRLPYGEAVKAKRWIYHINPAALERYIKGE